MDYTQCGSYPLTCLPWVALPEAYAISSIAVGVIRAGKAPHPQYVLRQDGSPWGGSVIIFHGNISKYTDYSKHFTPLSLRHGLWSLLIKNGAKCLVRN